MQLRPHQEKAVEMVRQSFRAGNRKTLLCAPCSFGKTHTAAYMMREAVAKGKRCVFFADRIKLIDQTLEAFDQWGISYGVMQADHWLTDPSKQVQIASIQTMARRDWKKSGFDFAIVDECHTSYKSTVEMMEYFTGVPFVGLSATPYSKGLGLIWDDLVIPIKQQELLEKGMLAPVHYYGGKSIDVKRLRKKKLSTGGYDFHPDDIAKASESDDALVGDIVKNWLAHGENSQTIAFCPSIKHSNYLCQMFEAAGISARHISGYTEEKTRKALYEGHDAGEFKILSCSKLLGVGYDSPQTRCLIDCFPTKSAIAYQQRAGRIQRIHDEKEYAIYLDHAGNTARFGFAHLMEPDALDTSEKQYKEENQVKKKEKEEAAVRDCPKCGRIMQGLKCACGYEIHITEVIESDATMLTRLDKIKKFTKEDKAHWLSNFTKIGRDSGYRDGWAAHQYKQKFGVWPRQIDVTPVSEIDAKVMGFVTSRRIAYYKKQQAG